MFNEVDTDQNGEMSEDEFVAFWKQVSFEPLVCLRSLFWHSLWKYGRVCRRLADVCGGRISTDLLRRLLSAPTQSLLAPSRVLCVLLWISALIGSI